MAIDTDIINYNQKPSKVILDIAKKSIAIEKYMGRKKHYEVDADEVDEARFMFAIVSYLDHLHDERLL